jgi:RNA polymerase sigma-70 factor, ECF subfamily
MEQERTRTLEALSEHWEAVRRRVASLVSSRRQDVDDLVQDAMLEACQAVDKNGAPDFPKAWLNRVAERVVYRRAGRQRAREARETALESHHSATTGSVLDEVAKSERQADLRKAVESLEEPSQSMVREHYWRERSASDIGQQMGTTPEAVRTRLLRGRAEIARRMAGSSERTP